MINKTSLLACLGLTITVASSSFLKQSYPIEDLNQTETSSSSMQQNYVNPTLAYDQSLGCGACIRSGYIYCMPGA